MALSQSTDRWGDKGLGGTRCPLGEASCRGGHGGLGGHQGGHGGLGHQGGYSGHGGGKLAASEPIALLKDTLL